MPALAAAHPTPDVLRAFGLGQLDDAAAEPVVGHLEQCSPCRNAVAALSGDDFLKRVRSAAGAMPTILHDVPPELANHAHYELIRELGRGGMGVVYLARNRLMDRLEVLKVVNPALLTQPGALDRFLREIRSAAMLNHPHVVAAYSALQTGDLLAFAMEYVEGDDLFEVIRARGENNPLPVANACHYILQTALGLQAAHEKGMVHRDIKPQNLILFREGKKHVVKILDFGLAKAKREQRESYQLTGSNQMMGTPDYLAPEQALDAAKADIRADIYSLGCTLYFLLTGEPPFAGTSLLALLQAHQLADAPPLCLKRLDVPADLAAVVGKMMAKEPGQRYQTPLEVTKALLPFVKQGAAGPNPALSVQRSVGPVAAARAATVAPAASVWETLTSGSVTPADRCKPGAVPSRQAPIPRSASSKRRLAWIGVPVCLLLLGLVATDVFRVKTKDGTIVLENLPADAEVLVDGEKVTVTWGDGKTAEVRVKPGTHQVAIRQGGVNVVGEKIEIEAGGQGVIAARFESSANAPLTPTPGRSDGLRPGGPVPGSSPINDYDELVRGPWVPVLSSEKEFNQLLIENKYKGAQPNFGDGILTCLSQGMSFPLVPAKDVIIRAQVKYINGQYVYLTLRVDTDEFVRAWFNGGGGFGIARNHKHRGYRDLTSRKIPEKYDDMFFEFAFAVVGNQLTLYANGRKLLEARDDAPTRERGLVVVGAKNGAGVFRNIEVKVLDK